MKNNFLKTIRWRIAIRHANARNPKCVCVCGCVRGCVGVCGCVWVWVCFHLRTTTHIWHFTYETRPHKNQGRPRVLKLAARAIQLKLGGNMSRSSLWRLSVRFSHKSPRLHCEKSESIGPRFCSEKSCVHHVSSVGDESGDVCVCVCGCVCVGWGWGVCVCVCFLLFCLFVCFKWSFKTNSLTTHLGMVICTHYLAWVYSKMTQGYFLQTFTSLRKCHYKDNVCFDKSFLDGTVFALAFFELWERTDWHPVSSTQRLTFVCFCFSVCLFVSFLFLLSLLLFVCLFVLIHCFWLFCHYVFIIGWYIRGEVATQLVCQETLIYLLPDIIVSPPKKKTTCTINLWRYHHV